MTIDRKSITSVFFALLVVGVVSGLVILSRVRAAPWPPEKAFEFIQSRMEMARARTGAYPASARALGLRQSRSRLWIYFASGPALPPVDYSGGEPPALTACVPQATSGTYVLCAIAEDGRTRWRVDPTHVQQLSE